MSNATNLSALDFLSLETGQFQKPAFYVWILSGLIAMIGNTLTVYTIMKTKSLHSNCMRTLAVLAVCDCFCGFTLTLQGSRKLYLTLRGYPETNYQYVCFLWGAPLTWLSSVSDGLTLAVNFDRWLATTLPFVYRTKLSKRYIFLLNGLGWMVPTVFWASGFYMAQPRKLLPVCYGLSSPDKWFQDLYSPVRGTVAGLNLLLFFVTLTFLKRRLDKTKAIVSLQERKKIKEEMEISMIKTFGVILLVYIFFKLVSYAFVSYLIYLGGEMQFKMNAFSGIPVGLYSASHFFVYFGMCKSFRKAFLSRLLHRSQVVPIGSG